MIPKGEQAQEFIRRMLSDTGFLARNVLGMNKDGDDGEPGKGGVRTYGPHQDMVANIDDEDKRLVICLMPRNSYKSSIVRARIIREILSNPNCSILLCMHDLEKAKERVAKIKEDLINNEIIKELFGDLKGPVWKADRFITSLRSSDSNIQDPTLLCCSRDALPTGGHYHLIILDDIIDDQGVRTEGGVANSVRALRYIMPLRLITGQFRGKIIDVGTLYDESDVHHFILEQPGWHKVKHEIGYELHELPDGRLELIGENPGFPYLTKEFLEEQLSVMGFNVWMSQYKNRVIGAQQAAFKRDQFQAMNWSDKMREFTGYLLTDVATSDKEEACRSVLIYVGLDEQLKMYILDLQIGHWQIGEFIEKFFQMRSKWATKVCHQAEVMEQAPQNLTYRSFMDKKARELGTHLNLIQPQRNLKGTSNKGMRILRLQPRFMAREVFVVNTVPKTYIDLGKIKELWNPDGYVNEGITQPSGRLVDEFIRFHPNKRSDVDIPDALAQIDEVDTRTGERLCFYRKPSSKILTQENQRVKLQNRRPYRSRFGFGGRF